MDKFVEVQKNLSVTNHRLGSFWMCAHPDSWIALPQKVKDSVERLKQNGFYNRWRREFGAKAWSLLEAQRGPLP